MCLSLDFPINPINTSTEVALRTRCRYSIIYYVITRINFQLFSSSCVFLTTNTSSEVVQTYSIPFQLHASKTSSYIIYIHTWVARSPTCQQSCWAFSPRSSTRRSSVVLGSPLLLSRCPSPPLGVSSFSWSVEHRRSSWGSLRLNPFVGRGLVHAPCVPPYIPFPLLLKKFLNSSYPPPFSNFPL